MQTLPTQILQSFVRDHGNAIVENHFAQRNIDQLSKLTGASMRLLVTSEEVSQTLANETVTIFSNQYSFQEYNVLGS